MNFLTSEKYVNENLIKMIRHGLILYKINTHICRLEKICENLDPLSSIEYDAFKSNIPNIPQELEFYLTKISRVMYIMYTEPYLINNNLLNDRYLQLTGDIHSNTYIDIISGKIVIYELKEIEGKFKEEIEKTDKNLFEYINEALLLNPIKYTIIIGKNGKCYKTTYTIDDDEHVTSVTTDFKIKFANTIK